MIELIEQYWFYLFPQIIVTALAYFFFYAVLNKLEKYKGRWFYYPVIIVPALILLISDLILQVEITILFLDVPKDWLVTGRMERYKLLSDMHLDHDKLFLYDLAYKQYHSLSRMNKFRYKSALLICDFLNKNGQRKRHC